MLGKKVFDLVGIKCPSYNYVREANCVISDDIKKYDAFYNPFEFGMKGYSLSEIKEKLMIRFEEGMFSNLQEVYFQLNIMHFIDILFSNIDRHISNFGFSITCDRIAYIVVFDNADFLQEFDKATRPMSLDSSDPLSFIFTSKREEAQKFFEDISENERQYFVKLYELFSPVKLLTMIKMIEKENGIKVLDKVSIVKRYLCHYFMVGKLLGDKKKIK